jgi:hypothetical protein
MCPAPPQNFAPLSCLIIGWQMPVLKVHWTGSFNEAAKLLCYIIQKFIVYLLSCHDAVSHNGRCCHHEKHLRHVIADLRFGWWPLARRSCQCIRLTENRSPDLIFWVQMLGAPTCRAEAVVLCSFRLESPQESQKYGSWPADQSLSVCHCGALCMTEFEGR